MVTISCNFEGDLYKIVEAAASYFGLSPKLKKDPKKLIEKFFLMDDLLLAKQNWVVEISDELQQKRFANELHDGFEEIIRKARSGESLNAHLSKKIKKLEYDVTLNDWGIHHLHLGSKVKKDGFQSRTDELLFVMKKGATLYCIDIQTHNAGNDGTQPLKKFIPQQELLEIVYRNWPNLLTVMKGVLAGKQGFNDSEMMQLRERGGISLVQLSGGIVLYPPGGIIASNKSSTETNEKIWSFLYDFINLEPALKKNKTRIGKLILGETGVNYKYLKFTLVYRDAWWIQEKNSGLVYSLEDILKLKKNSHYPLVATFRGSNQ